MRRNHHLLGTTCAGLLALVAQPLAAQSSSPAPSIEQLERELAVRDAIIADLLARVERLERTTGAAPGGAVGSSPAGGEREQAEPGFPANHAEQSSLVGGAEADRALERTLVQAGALLLPAGAIEITPQFGHARMVETTPTFVMLQDETFVGTLERRRSQSVADMSLRIGLPLDSQIEVDVPYQLVNQSFVTRIGFAPQGKDKASGSAFGDVTLALAHTLMREHGWLPDLVGRLRWNTGSGRTTDDGITLGGGIPAIGGSLTAIKRQDPLVFVGGLSYDRFFTQGEIDPGNVFGLSLGTLLAASPETSLRLVFDQRLVTGASLGGVRLDGSDRTIAFLTVGASSLLHRGILLDVAARLGLTDDSPDYALVVSLPVRF